jgi:hypothetical protein
LIGAFAKAFSLDGGPLFDATRPGSGRCGCGFVLVLCSVSITAMVVDPVTRRSRWLAATTGARGPGNYLLARARFWTPFMIENSG